MQVAQLLSELREVPVIPAAIPDSSDHPFDVEMPTISLCSHSAPCSIAVSIGIGCRLGGLFQADGSTMVGSPQPVQRTAHTTSTSIENMGCTSSSYRYPEPRETRIFISPTGA